MDARTTRRAALAAAALAAGTAGIAGVGPLAATTRAGATAVGHAPRRPAASRSAPSARSGDHAGRFGVLAGEFTSAAVAHTVIRMLADHGFPGFTYGETTAGAPTPGTIGTTTFLDHLGATPAAAKGPSGRILYPVTLVLPSRSAAGTMVHRLRVKGFLAFALPAARLAARSGGHGGH